ncbi:MAG TPA: hypothetical protein VGN98_10965 [Tianweitania sediminis]|jgi:hypothetical protein|nr:hypothetical protein [Tianweitania sediminis]
MMRIYPNDETSKKLEKAAERRQTSPEAALDRMVVETDEADAQSEPYAVADDASDGGKSLFTT